MELKSMLAELREKRFFALERAPVRPTRILRKILNELGFTSLRYSYLQPQPTGVGRSLSGMHGFGEFPLHTDGAHQDEPPDYIFLMAPPTRSTPTFVADPYIKIDPKSEYAKQAIFSVQRRGRTFNTHIIGSKNGANFIRYNSDTMSPKNSGAREVERRMHELRSHVVPLYWERYALLILDNRSMLHGRAQVEGMQTSYLRRLEVRL